MATAPIDDSPLAGALLTLRLMAAEEPGAEMAWQEGTAAGSLAVDLIAASGGVPVEMRGRLLVARFPGVHPACLTARRLQWAMQGLAGQAPAAAVALSALIQTGDESSSDNEGAALSELEKAPAGKILLAQRAGQVLDQEPGFATRKGGKGGLELVWRAPDEQTTRAADEIALARFNRDSSATDERSIQRRSCQETSGHTRPMPLKSLSRPHRTGPLRRSSRRGQWSAGRSELQPRPWWRSGVSMRSATGRKHRRGRPHRATARRLRLNRRARLR